MPELTREEKLKLIEKLPPRLQEFMYSEDTGADLLYLGKKYNLPDEKVHLLSKLTGDVVLGIKQIAFLAQEINSKILPDAQMAMDLAQELYADVLTPVLAPPPAPAPVPATMPRPATSPTSSADRYRESATPEVVDLRRAPPVAPAPAPIAPRPPMTTRPLIEAEPHKVSPTPLIAAPEGGAAEGEPRQWREPRPSGREAEPHKASVPAPAPVPAPLSGIPQVILRSPGLPPTDLPRDILDLRKDKGEF